MNNYEIQSREWWVQEWIDLLEKSRFKKRLERARNYAMQGNVLGIEFKGPKVLAKVQGTAPEPYQVSLSLDPFTDEQWDYVIETMSQRAIFSAQLLAGEMPPNIQEVFTANGLSIFPFTLSDIHARCSCPDKEIPCKHIGAVYYQLGDRFSEDPFVIFQLRGRPKEQILDTLRKLRRGSEQNSENEITTAETSQLSGEDTSSLPATPLKVEEFWQYDEPLDSSLVVIAPTGDTVLDVLGAIPLASGSSQPVMQYLDTVYQTVSQQAFLAAMNLEES
ncbi:SWIM zinc finger family protein [Coleofasciculus sp. FACHB-64]|uniref:SWIM zinc finger family protein n=1 Tax=Cyanophyceae TaxID=3028117 RepID=UPI0016892ED1|nr:MULTISPECIES: SWIM zinc finger family protein [unclassified Coleofasciculus]MBD1840565.1 SWIM zinc finger family protein [Coleofasciculus sp. FACHB-501]MBD2044231.1 SWIM zinc finger family protein [Coleofasciculus sp. FACHB-64]